MKSWRIAFVTLLFSTGLFAQEQLALRLNEQGIIKILEMALKYNTSNGEPKTFIIPHNVYKFTLPKSKFESNPIVKVANEISDLNLNRDLDFYFHTTDIKFSGEADPKSLKVIISNSHDHGFDLKLHLNIPKVVIKGSRLSLCEDKKKNANQCGDGLKATLSNVNVVSKGQPLKLAATFRVQTNGNVAKLRLLSVESNLEEKDRPALDISFQSVVIPKISIVINDQETELDTSKLKDEILKRKDFLAQKLISFAADFITQDLTEMVNVYLINKQISTIYQILNKDNPLTFNEYLNRADSRAPEYLRPTVDLVNAKDPMSVMMAQMAEVITNARAVIALRKLSTPGNKDLELAGLVNLVLNNRSIAVGDTLGNSDRKLPKLDLSAMRNTDLVMAISEPLINGSLDLVNSTNLFQELTDELVNIRGFSVSSVKAHFQTGGTVAVIVNAKVDLKNLDAKDWKESIKYWMASFLERNNNKAVIYFPIQIEVTPTFVKKSDGTVGLALYVRSPFDDMTLRNTFHYPTNVPKMYEIVREGVMEKLQTSLVEFTNKNYNIDLTKFLNQAGVEFSPRIIDVKQDAYLVLGLDIKNIKFTSKNPNQR